MGLKKALNVLVVAFWVCAQTAMAYAHNVSGTPADGGHKAAEVHKSAGSDCLNHAASGEDSESHHGSSSLEQCCSIACSVVGPLTAHELITGTTDREFAVGHLAVLMAVSPGLPTPPPNTTI